MGSRWRPATCAVPVELIYALVLPTELLHDFTEEELIVTGQDSIRHAGHAASVNVLARCGAASGDDGSEAAEQQQQRTPATREARIATPARMRNARRCRCSPVALGPETEVRSPRATEHG
ncbi:hypothetical protein HPB50_022960 [Hyalomma asiaticum]|uniref:Uncharacterized protein n=1 Tax=Hyalomma asiaticum TaxID=266040 RepID=A0ACB7SAY6_HYAAI|nr:hypothetical protein HPB50_022960 [Hyalomma asiaticum]